MSAKIELTPEQIHSLFECSKLRMPMRQIASVLGISKATLERLAAENDHDNEIYEAIEKGRAEASQNIRNTAYRMAISGLEPAMTIFWLKTQEGWRETTRFEHTGADGEPIKTMDLSPEQRGARIAELLDLRKKLEDAKKLPGE